MKGSSHFSNTFLFLYKLSIQKYKFTETYYTIMLSAQSDSASEYFSSYDLACACLVLFLMAVAALMIAAGLAWLLSGLP